MGQEVNVLAYYIVSRAVCIVAIIVEWVVNRGDEDPKRTRAGLWLIACACVLSFFPEGFILFHLAEAAGNTVLDGANAIGDKVRALRGAR